MLISIDGFRADYLDRGITPNLSRLAGEGATGPMRPSFPSVTFPNHYTLVTGLHPDHHGIVGNNMIDAELGRIDGILHCAAEFRGLTPLEHTDPADFARAVHVNLTAPWWLVQACLPLLRQAPDAALVLAVDDPQRVGQAYWGGYGVAQHGLRALLGMLSAELANTAVRVAGLQPGPMRTGLRARAYAEDHDRRLADAAAYAGACVTLLSPAGAAHRGTIWAPEADALPA